MAHDPDETRELRAAFRGFEPAVIARFGPRDIARLMQDEGIVRNRMKIEAAIDNARAYLRLAERIPLAEFLWDSRWAAARQLQIARRCAGRDGQSRRISKALKVEGFRFVGPTTIYAFMQSVGMVNDHLVTCHRYQECAALQRAVRCSQAPGDVRMPKPRARSVAPPALSEPPRAWQRMLSGRRLDLLDPSPSTSKSRTSPTGSHALRAGTGRPRAITPSRSPSTCCSWRRSPAIESRGWPARWRLAALLHDAPEYVVGDLISPFKTASASTTRPSS